MGTDRYGEKNGSYLQPSVQIRTNPYPKSLHTNSRRDKSDKSDNKAPIFQAVQLTIVRLPPGATVLRR